MTWDVCTNTTPTARKEYRCDACEVINNFMMDDDFSEEEILHYLKAEEEGFMILEDTVYTKSAGLYEGEASVFRARPLMDDICVKYELYDL